MTWCYIVWITDSVLKLQYINNYKVILSTVTSFNMIALCQ